MKILSIETSCDETAAAIIDGNGKIISNQIYSQIETHSKYGGVMPNIAAREHLKHVDKITKNALQYANCKISDIDIISATTGPGLLIALMVGAMYAKGIAIANNLPFYGIDHIESHILMSLHENDKLKFPFLTILISGGHSMFVLVLGIGKYKIIGQSIDDALGESFDKVSKMMGHGYPGGPIIEKMAKNGDENRFKLPMPLCFNRKENIDNTTNLSFSGLKTASMHVINDLKQKSSFDAKDQHDFAASFQRTIADILIYKTKKAIQKCNIKITGISISGGVASNLYIRKKIESHFDNIFYPKPEFCTDNAAMIGFCTLLKYNQGIKPDIMSKVYANCKLFS